MEKGPDDIKKKLFAEQMDVQLTPEQSIPIPNQVNIVNDDTILVRLVPERYYNKEENRLTSDAYRPKRKENTETGLERNVSTKPRGCLKNDNEIESYNNSRRNHRSFEIRAEFPNMRGYPCVQDKECHVGISGDMLMLFGDEDTLNILAINSTPLFPKV